MCFPVVHCLKKKWGGGGGGLSFCVKPSYCLPVGACTKNGKGRTEMSEKCQMPAGPVQFISPAETFTPGEEGTDQGDGGGARSHLLMTLNKTGCGATRNKSDGM